ncbi:MAG: GNAT family N-acetyltransferase [Acidimicrobiales bacterium]
MRAWSSSEIFDALAALDASAQPDDVVQLETAEYRLLRYPERVLSPTFPAAQVVWSNITRPIDTVIDEVAREVHAWGLHAVYWWVTDATRPKQTEAALRERGAELSDTFHVLARELDEGAVESRDVADITVKLVRDTRSLRNAVAVETRGWSRSRPPDEAIRRRLIDTLGELESWTGFQVVAFVDGEPAATGRCTPAGEVARLWGAVTLPAFRRRGCYQAVLSTRLRLAYDRGATLALTRGRPLTSGPLLTRAGFSAYGEERCYRLFVT